MQTYLARIFRAMAATTLGIGGGCGLLVFISMMIMGNSAFAFDFGWKAGLIIGLLFAFVLLGIMLPIDVSSHLFLSKGSYNDIWELEQTRQLEVDGQMKEVVAAVREALLSVAYIGSVSDDPENQMTRASTGPSWKSPGEDIEVEINPVAENKWNLKCTSKSKNKNLMFDYGKNYENVETWRSGVAAYFERKQAKA